MIIYSRGMLIQRGEQCESRTVGIECYKGGKQGELESVTVMLVSFRSLLYLFVTWIPFESGQSYFLLISSFVRSIICCEGIAIILLAAKFLDSLLKVW